MKAVTPVEARILLACDGPGLEDYLAPYLAGGGLRVLRLHGKARVLRTAAGSGPTLVILDIAPGERRTLDLLVELRSRTGAAVVLVGGSEARTELVAGLEAGADDAVAGLPAGNSERLRELRVRVLRVLRRLTAPRGGNGSRRESDIDVLRFEGWRLDLSRRRLVSPTRREITLTAAEFDLLAVLSRHAGTPLSREELMRLTRERGHDPGDRTIDTQVTRLRRKIEADSRRPSIIKTVRGQGYLFALPLEPF